MQQNETKQHQQLQKLRIRQIFLNERFRDKETLLV